LKFGLQLSVSPRYCAEIASVAEGLGFDTIYVPEHLAFPVDLRSTYPYSADGLPSLGPETPCFDPFALLGFLAACTRTVRLATNVCIVPLRHPLFLLRSLNTVDRLSGGQVTLGAGVGWLEDEFRWVGEPFGDRGRRTDAIIGVLRRAWTGDVIEHRDEHFDFGPLASRPTPLQAGGIPIHVGGASPAALRRAGRLGDGWLEIGSTDLDEVLAKLAVVRAARADAGREHLPFEVTTKVNFASDPSAVARAEEAGVTRISVLPRSPTGGPLTPDVFGEWARRFRDEVMEGAMGDA
jgi:probable F420-dependent oxidoreductase